MLWRFFALLMTPEKPSARGECMNRGGQMRKNFDNVLAEFLARLRCPVSLCIGDGGNAQSRIPLELTDGFFAFRFVQKLWEIEKTAENSALLVPGSRAGACRGPVDPNRRFGCRWNAVCRLGERS